MYTWHMLHLGGGRAPPIREREQMRIQSLNPSDSFPVAAEPRFPSEKLRFAWTRSPAWKLCQLETTTLDLTQLIAEGSTNAANFHWDNFEKMFWHLIFILKATWLPKQQRDYFLASKKRTNTSSDGFRWNFGQNKWEIVVNHNLGQCQKLFTAFLFRFVTGCTMCTADHNWDRIANCVRSQKSNKIVKLNLINIECIFYFLYSRIVTFDTWLPNSAYSYFDFFL